MLSSFRYGPGIGSLNVYLQRDGSIPILMWSISGEQPDQWHQGKVGFIIHDDHTMYYGYCPTLPFEAIPSDGLTTTTVITTPMFVFN